MLRRLVGFVERHAQVRGILVSLALSVVLGVLPLSYAIARIRAGSPDAAPLDMAASYTPDEAYTMIARYGADARDYYVFNAFTADVVAPALFGLTIALISVALLRPITAPGSRWRIVAIAGGVAGLAADVVENGLLATVVSRFPERLDTVVQLACAATVVKRCIVFATLGLVLIAALVLLVRRVTTTRSADPDRRDPPRPRTAAP